jgi:hypothetical protein
MDWLQTAELPPYTLLIAVRSLPLNSDLSC